MCDYSTHGQSRQAEDGETITMDQLDHGGRGFRAAKDRMPVCVNSGTYVLFSDASPGLRSLAGMDAPELRANYEHPQGNHHGDPYKAATGDGLRFIGPGGGPLEFVPFSRLPVGISATIHLVKEDVAVENVTQEAEAERVLVPVRR